MCTPTWSEPAGLRCSVPTATSALGGRLLTDLSGPTVRNDVNNSDHQQRQPSFALLRPLAWPSPSPLFAGPSFVSRALYFPLSPFSRALLSSGQVPVHSKPPSGVWLPSHVRVAASRRPSHAMYRLAHPQPGRRRRRAWGVGSFGASPEEKLAGRQLNSSGCRASPGPCTHTRTSTKHAHGWCLASLQLLLASGHGLFLGAVRATIRNSRLVVRRSEFPAGGPF